MKSSLFYGYEWNLSKLTIQYWVAKKTLVINRVLIHFDFNDWWIGYYRGSNYHFVCIIPTFVIRWRR